MSSQFSVDFCRGPYHNITRETICCEIINIVEKYNEDDLGSLWENFSFMESIFAVATEDIGGDDYGIGHSSNSQWMNIVKWLIGKKIYRAAEEIYLNDRSDVVSVVIDGKSWIITGEMSYYDSAPSDSFGYIQLIKFTNLDDALAAVCHE
jgi:hypothetical protein